MNILPDLIERNLNIIFSGTAAGDRSAERGTYYARKGNMFYPILFKCGFTTRILKPEEFPELIGFKIGLTDLAKTVHGMDKDIKDTDYDTKDFEDKILMYQPRIVCFNGKNAARIFLGFKKTRDVILGLQEKTINKTKLYVATSTSSMAKAHWDEETWHGLESLISKS